MVIVCLNSCYILIGFKKMENYLNLYITMEPRTSEYTGLIYQSDKIQISYDKDDDFYKVVALDDIRAGELLLAEHVVEGSIDMLYFIVAHNQKLRRELYPRRPLEKSEHLITVNKVMANCFGRENGEMNLGVYMSKINANCSPNCIAIFEELPWFVRSRTISFVIGKVFAVANIRKNDEITINYHPKFGHEDNPASYQCSCGRSETERVKIFETCHKVHDIISKMTNYELPNEVLIVYLQNSTVKQTIFRQHLAKTADIVYIDKNTPVYANHRHTDACITDERVAEPMIQGKWRDFSRDYDRAITEFLLHD